MALSAERRSARIAHLVDSARALVRESGDAGFSMMQLATRAGVSPATPYNLAGSKGEIMRLVVRREFEDFDAKLGRIQHASPLAALLDATALVVTHYAADPQFYRGLFRATLGMEASEIHDQMLAQGRAFWVGFVRDAVAAGELEAFVAVQPLTDFVLRIIGVTTQAWLAENWSSARFGLEMAHGIRLGVAAVAAAPVRTRLVDEIAQLGADIDRELCQETARTAAALAR
jgi:AcrR family transcriptional regulator